LEYKNTEIAGGIMFDGGNRRTSRRDGFRWVLMIIFLFQIFFTFHLAGKLQEQLGLCTVFKSAEETDRPIDGQYVCLHGDVVKENAQVIDPAFEKEFCRLLRIDDPVRFDAVFTHSVKRGKNSYTVTDRTISGKRDFKVLTSAGEVGLRRRGDRIYSFHSVSLKPQSGFSTYSPVSTSLHVTYFAPRQLYLFGLASRDSKGATTLDGDSRKPLIVSEISKSSLINQTRFASVLTGAAIVYFLTTLFIPWKNSIRRQIERTPSICYIFDVTGGPESIAIFLLVLYAVGSLILGIGFASDHQFRVDQVNAVLFLGFSILVHVSRGVEYFYVADKRDGYLYEYSRGFFTFSKVRLGLISTLKLWIDVQRGSKGSKSYYLKAGVPQGKTYDLGGTGSSEATLREIMSEFNFFRGRRPDVEGCNFPA